MQLWSGVLSPFSAKVRLVLAEKGLDYETREIPWTRATLWGPKPPEFLALSPHGKVPVLVDGETAIYDSTVIIEYLEDCHPTPSVFPATPAGRARCRQLEDEADACMVDEVTPVVQEMFTKQDDTTRDHERVRIATEALHRRYDVWERETTDREFLCDTFSVADIAAFMAVAFASTLGVAPGEQHPALQAWFARVQERPSVAREFEAIMTAAAAV